MGNNNIDKSNQGSLGLVACVTMITGGMIGSAIFSLSGMTIYYAGPSAVVSWIIAAVILLAYGLIVAELATIFPKSGGVFVFPAKSLGKTEEQGKIWGWFSAWGYITANLAGIAFSAIYVATYLGVGFPAFNDHQVLLAVAAVVFCGALNLYRISVAGKANTLLLTLLVGTILTFVGVGLFSGNWNADLITPFFSQGSQGSSGFISAIPNAMVAYGSIVAIAFMVSEVKNPNKNVPKSIMIAMGIVVSLYALVVLTTVGLISTEYLIENPGMRYIPLYAAAFTSLSQISWLPQLLSVSAVLALLTTILVLIAITARAVFATAEAGLLPKPLANISKSTGAPVNATIVVVLVSGGIALFPQFTEQIVDLGSLFAAITIIINCCSLVVARRKNAYVEGNYRAPGGKWLPIVTPIVIAATYIPRILDGSETIYFTLAWYAIAGIIISVNVRRKNTQISA